MPTYSGSPGCSGVSAPPLRSEQVRVGPHPIAETHRKTAVAIAACCSVRLRWFLYNTLASCSDISHSLATSPATLRRPALRGWFNAARPL